MFYSQPNRSRDFIKTENGKNSKPKGLRRIPFFAKQPPLELMLEFRAVLPRDSIQKKLWTELLVDLTLAPSENWCQAIGHSECTGIAELPPMRGCRWVFGVHASKETESPCYACELIGPCESVHKPDLI